MHPDRLGSIRAIQTQQEFPLICSEEADAVEATTQGQIPLEKAHPCPVLSEKAHVPGAEVELPPLSLTRRILRQNMRSVVHAEVSRIVFYQLHVCSTLTEPEHQGSEVLISD